MDADLRTLQRRAATGDPGARAAFERARVRADLIDYPLVRYIEVMEAHVWLLGHLIDGALAVMMTDHTVLDVFDILDRPRISPLEFVPLFDPRGEVREHFRSMYDRLHDEVMLSLAIPAHFITVGSARTHRRFHSVAEHCIHVSE